MDTSRGIPDRTDAVATEPVRDYPDPGKPGGPGTEDLTGRDRLVSNVLFSWGTYLVFIVAGFVLPRMIDRRLGQDLLGIWDFAWSLVTYFGLVEAGIGASVNRYIAQYRTAGNTPAVNGVVSSASCILGVAGTLVLALTVLLSLLLPGLFGDRLGAHVREVQWVVLLLGASIGVQISFSAFGGVLTGCHRWGLYNVNTSGWYAATVAGMIIALSLGGGLRALATICLLGEILTGAGRMVLAYRVCEDLRLRPSLVRWNTVQGLLAFGGKTLIPGVSNLLLNQTTSILILAYLNPAALALYARPRSLLNHLGTLVQKMAMTLTPTTSSLQSTGDLVGIQALFVKAVGYSFYLALPAVLVMAVFGGPILQVWMGSNYVSNLVPAILAVGCLASMAQMPVYTILAGLNAHGRAGMAQFVASVCSVALMVVGLGYLRWGLAGAAVASTLPLMIVNIVYLPAFACRKLGMSVAQYALGALARPALCSLPFLFCLIAARILFLRQPITAFILGVSAGTVVLLPIYWRFALSASLKSGIVFKLLPRRANVVAGPS
jgi:O-antigen/teichoic acid export membrane protein